MYFAAGLHNMAQERAFCSMSGTKMVMTQHTAASQTQGQRLLITHPDLASWSPYLEFLTFYSTL